MKKEAIIFTFIFFCVYFGMHLYLFFRFTKFFDIHPLLLFWIIIAFGISYPVSNVFERIFGNKTTRTFYYLTSLWFGFLLFLVASALLQHIISLFIDIPFLASGVGILAVGAFFTLHAVYQAKHMKVKHITLPMSKIKNPLTLVQITDLHLGSIHGRHFLKRVVSKINNIKPSFVAITGDLIDGTRKVTKSTLAPLNNLKAPSFFCFGNHDHYYGDDEVMRLISTTPIKVLRNEKTLFKSIQIVGVDHVEDLKKNPYLNNVSIDKNKPALLLIHAPVDTKKIERLGYDVQLSGHTHNGQLFPFNLLARLFYQYVHGKHIYKNLAIYISPGTATWGPPMRLGSRSELTVITLEPKKKS